MATSSEVKAGLDDIAKIIREQRGKVLGMKSEAGVVSGVLGGLPTTYADLIATVQAYGTSNAFEANAKAEMAKLASEYTDLKAVSDGIAGVTP